MGGLEGANTCKRYRKEAKLVRESRTAVPIFQSQLTLRRDCPLEEPHIGR